MVRLYNKITKNTSQENSKTPQKELCSNYRTRVRIRSCQQKRLVSSLLELVSLLSWACVSVRIRKECRRACLGPLNQRREDMEGGVPEADISAFRECIALSWRNPYVLRLAFSAGIGGLLFGYDTG